MLKSKFYILQIRKLYNVCNHRLNKYFAKKYSAMYNKINPIVSCLFIKTFVSNFFSYKFYCSEHRFSHGVMKYILSQKCIAFICKTQLFDHLFNPRIPGPSKMYSIKTDYIHFIYVCACACERALYINFIFFK